MSADKISVHDFRDKCVYSHDLNLSPSKVIRSLAVLYFSADETQPGHNSQFGLCLMCFIFSDKVSSLHSVSLAHWPYVIVTKMLCFIHCFPLSHAGVMKNNASSLPELWKFITLHEPGWPARAGVSFPGFFVNAIEIIAKSRTLRLQSCFILLFLRWRKVPFIQELSGVYTSPFLDTDDLKLALRARKVSGAFEKQAPWS